MDGATGARGMALLGVAAAVLCLAGPLHAADYCVRQGASGAGNGSDWQNAYPSLPATLVRGATYYIADGTYSAYTFDDAASGTLVITVKKATIADHGTSSGWLDSYGDGQANFGSLTFTTSYWVVDGQTGGGPGSWESGFGIKLTASESKIIRLNNGASNIVLRHLDMEHRGRFTHDSNDDILYALGPSKNVTISYCCLRDVSRCHLLTINSDGFVIEYSKLARNGAGGDTIHREAWSAQADDNVTIRHSVFENISNTAFLGLVNGSGDATNWQIYGNVFVRTPSDPSAVSAFLTVRYASPHFLSARDWRIYNNAFVNFAGLGAGFNIENGSGNVAYNNVWYNNTVNSIAFSNTAHDYNWFYNNYRIDGVPEPRNLDPALVASEAHGVLGTGDPFLDWAGGDYRLAAGTSAIDSGVGLGSPYDVDAFGNVRGADGAWDMGPYEYGGAGPTGTVESWHVLSQHGEATISVAVSDGYIHPLLAGPLRVRVTFTQAFDPATLVPAAFGLTGQQGGDLSALIQSATAEPGNTSAVLTLAAPLPDRDRYTFAVLPTLLDADGQQYGGDMTLELACLVGDVNGSGRITAADVLATRGNAGQVVSEQTARCDLDGSGRITATDMRLVFGRLAQALP